MATRPPAVRLSVIHAVNIRPARDLRVGAQTSIDRAESVIRCWSYEKEISREEDVVITT